MAEVHIGDLHHVVSVLYGLVRARHHSRLSRTAPPNQACMQTPAPTEHAHQQAVQWLLEFQETQEAWTLLPSLLATAPENVVQYYAANGIYAKVRSEWLRLGTAAKVEMHEQLWQLLTMCRERMHLTTTRRICLAIATCIVLSRTSGNVLECTRRVRHLLSSDTSDQTCITVIEVLRAIPDELESQQITGIPRENLLEEMSGCMGEILIIHSSMVPSTEQLLEKPALFGSVLASLDGWINACSISTENLATSAPHLFEAVLYGAVWDTGDENLPRLAAACIESSLSFAAPATRTLRVCALCDIVRTLLEAFHTILRDVRVGKFCAARGLIRILDAVSKHDAVWLVGSESLEFPEGISLQDFTAITEKSQVIQGNLTIGGSPIGLGVLAGGAVLELLSWLPLSMLEDMLDFFTPIQMLPLAERHPFYRRTAFKLLVSSICSRVAFPPQLVPFDEEEMRKLRGRHSCILDPLNDCFVNLQGEYISVLMTSIMLAHEQLSHAALPSATDAADARAKGLEMMLIPGKWSDEQCAWQYVEAVVFCLSAISRDLNELLEDSDIDVANTDAVPVENVAGLIVALTSVSPQRMALELASTSARWFGSLSSWISFALQGGHSSIRCSTAFQVGVTPGVEASIVCLPPADLLSCIIKFLLSCLTIAPSSPIAMPSTFDILRFLGLTCGRTVRARVLADSDGDDPEDDTAADAASASSCAAHAANSLSALLRIYRHSPSDENVVKALADALQESVGLNALPYFAHAQLLRTLLDVASGLVGSSRELAIRYICEPVLSELSHVVSMFPLAPQQEMAYCFARVTTLVVACLDSTAADPVGLTAFGAVVEPVPGGDLYGDTASSSLSFLVQACWPLFSQVVASCHDRDELLVCSFRLLEKCARNCWSNCAGSIPQLIEEALQIFQERLFPDALGFIEQCLGTWASEARYELGHQQATDDSKFSADETAFVESVAARVSAAVAAMLHADNPLVFADLSADAIAAFFDFVRKMLDLSPRVVFHSDVFRIALVGTGKCASHWDRRSAKAASSLLQRVFMHAEIMTTYDEQIQACMAEHGSALMSQLLEALLDDRSTATVFTSLTEIIRILLECYGDKGAQDAMSSALEMHASAMEREETDRLGVPAGELSLALETGICSLSREDRAAITALCARYASTDRRRFNMLFSDLAKLCKRLTMKDALLSHIIAGSENGAKKTTRSSRRLLEETESFGGRVDLG